MSLLRFLGLSLGLTATLALPLAETARAGYVDAHPSHAAYGRVRLVVPMTSGDAAVWAFRLRNLLAGSRAAQQGNGSVEARVVLYGPGVKLLLQPNNDIKEAVDQLRAEGVQFQICNNTLKGMDLDWHGLYGVKEQDIVPSGFLEVGWLVNQGWAVDPMN